MRHRKNGKRPADRRNSRSCQAKAIGSAPAISTTTRPSASASPSSDRNADRKPSTRSIRPRKLGFDCHFVDDRPDLDDLAAAKFVDDILGEGKAPAVHIEAEEFCPRPIIEAEPAGNVWRIVKQHQHLEIEIGNLIEVLLEHGDVTRQPEPPAVMNRIVADELPEIGPVLPVQAGDVAAVYLREFGF